jgi:hypothetical protein
MGKYSKKWQKLNEYAKLFYKKSTIYALKKVKSIYYRLDV